MRSIALAIIENTLAIATAVGPLPEIEALVLTTIRLSRQLAESPHLAVKAGAESWTDGLALLIENIERGCVPSAKELERQLVVMDVAAAKIRNVMRARRLDRPPLPPPVNKRGALRTLTLQEAA